MLLVGFSVDTNDSVSLYSKMQNINTQLVEVYLSEIYKTELCPLWTSIYNTVINRALNGEIIPDTLNQVICNDVLA